MELNFPGLICPDPKCKSTRQYVAERGNRYGIYCNDCNRFIKWAGYREKTVIEARKAWLKEHE